MGQGTKGLCYIRLFHRFVVVLGGVARRGRHGGAEVETGHALSVRVAWRESLFVGFAIHDGVWGQVVETGHALSLRDGGGNHSLGSLFVMACCRDRACPVSTGAWRGHLLISLFVAGRVDHSLVTPFMVVCVAVVETGHALSLHAL